LRGDFRFFPSANGNGFLPPEQLGKPPDRQPPG